MLKTLQREDWVAEILKVRPLKMNEQSEVINSLCNIFKYNPVYFLYEKKGKCVISFIALTKGRNIYTPIHFFYSSLWMEDELSDTQYCQYLNEFISTLLITYSHIEIKLPLEMRDVRPFLWSNFSIKNYYTYVKSLDNLDYHPVTDKNIRKAKKVAYTCKQEALDELSLNLNLELFTDLKVYSKAKIKKIEEVIIAMSINGYLTSFNCYKNDELVASNLLFLDEKYKMAYTVLLNKTDRFNKDDVHSLLHDFFFRTLNEQGFNNVDLLGGDIAGIASFKSRFNPALKPHFLVTYNSKGIFVKKSIEKIKYSIRRVLAKIS